MLKILQVQEHHFVLSAPALIFSASAKCVEMYGSVTVTCTLLGYQYAMNSSKNITIGNAIRQVAGFTQNKEKCLIWKSNEYEAHHSSICGVGTNDSNSIKKEYHIIIEKMQQQEFTTWFCSEHEYGLFSNNYTFDLAGKFLTLFCNESTVIYASRQRKTNK